MLAKAIHTSSKIKRRREGGEREKSGNVEKITRTNKNKILNNSILETMLGKYYLKA